MEKNAKITIFMLLIWATAYIHPMCSSLNQELFASYRVATNLENLENLENSGNLTNYENLRKTQGNLNFCGKNLENSGKMKNM